MEALIRSYINVSSAPAQAAAYAAVGAIGTAVHYTVLATLLLGTSLPVVAASTIGAVFGGLLNYWLNHAKVFRSQVRHQVALPKFAAVASFGVTTNAAMLAVCVPTFGALPGQLIASATVLVSGFSLNRIWSFHE